MSWGRWIEHDGKGCPVPVGTIVEAVEEWSSGRITSQVACVEARPSAPSSWNWEYTGQFTKVLRYRIRKPKGLTILEHIAEQPQDERVGA